MEPVFLALRPSLYMPQGLDLASGRYALGLRGKKIQENAIYVADKVKKRD